jgi:cyclase
MAETVSVPVIASGGANTFEDFLAVFEGGRADAALAASIFHTETHSIEALKSYLSARGVPIRLPMSISSQGSRDGSRDASREAGR